uniref:Uncharacterized protein n=1 Tax=Rhizophora mucronata TaxID=61149 RepID=A0A2P2NCR0_RHIMU
MVKCSSFDGTDKTGISIISSSQNHHTNTIGVSQKPKT